MRTIFTHTKRIAGTVAVAVLYSMSAVAPAGAQTRPVATNGPQPAKIRQAIERVRFERPNISTQRVPAPHAVQGQLRPATRGMWVAVGAVTGAVVLATALSAGEEGDNGMRGVTIGLPVGAALGGWLTWRLTQ